MAVNDRTPPVTGIERDELLAQHIACSYLVNGCQNALFDLGLKACETSGLRNESVDQRAVKILEAILSSWRATAQILDRLQLKQQWSDDETFEAWLQLDRPTNEERTSRFAVRN